MKDFPEIFRDIKDIIDDFKKEGIDLTADRSSVYAEVEGRIIQFYSIEALRSFLYGYCLRKGNNNVTSITGDNNSN